MSWGSRARAALIGLAWVGLAGPAWAVRRERPADFAEISLRGGFSVGFGMLRLGGEAQQESIAFGGRVFFGSTKAVTRLLVDEASGAVFGYRLDAEPISSTFMGLRVDIRPLDAAIERQLLPRLVACPGCPTPRLASASSARFPPTQVVRDGDAMVIDLLVRPGTGEKIVDVLKFSLEAVTPEALDRVRERVSRASRHLRHGDELVARGSLDAALAEYQKALLLQPDAAIHVRAAQCHLRLDRPRQAEQEYERSVRLNPGDAEAWYSLGVLQHRRGGFGKALASYRRALELRRDWVAARRNLAIAHLDRRELERAFQEYRQAVAADAAILEAEDAGSVKPRDPGAQLYVLARIHASAQRWDAALAALKKAKDAGFKDLQRVRGEREFQPLLQDPRLVALVPGSDRS